MATKQIRAKALYNKEIALSYYKMGILCPEIPSLILPGQFLMLRAWSKEGYDPLLNRPFGIYKVIGEEEGIEILYKAVGRGTRIMAEIKPGEDIEILGPLGNGFPILKDWQEIFIVSGGVGIAPFYHLIWWIREKKGLYPAITLYHGGKGKDDMVCVDDFKALSIGLRLATEDGEVGLKGLIGKYFKNDITEGIRPSVIFACGPKGMLKEVAKVAIENGILCYVSIDRVMGCGIGTCLGCVVKTRRCKDMEREGGLGWGYSRVCVEGPVFDARDIIWEEL